MTPSTRALLAAAREGLGPDPAAAARVRAKLDALLAAPAAAAPASAAGSGLALKVAAAIALATATAAVVIAVPTSRATPTVAAAPVLDDLTAPEPPVVAVHTSTREPAAPSARPVEHAVRVAAPAPVVGHVPAVEVSLAREVELIDDAMASLRGGHATEALAAVAAYHRETSGHGQLTEEASAIEIEASCTLHLDIRDKLAAFDRTWPSSAQRARLTAACR